MCSTEIVRLNGLNVAESSGSLLLATNYKMDIYRCICIHIYIICICYIYVNKLARYRTTVFS